MRIAVVILALLFTSFDLLNLPLNQNGLFHAYLMDEYNGGKIAIERMCKNNGTMFNDAMYKNNAMYFDGTGDYFSAPNHRTQSELVNKFAIMCWVKADNLSQSQRFIFDKPNATNSDTQFGVIWEYIANSYSFYAQTQTGTNPYSSGSHIAISDDFWHHIAYSYNGATFKGYLDGVEKVSFNSVFTLRTTSTLPIYVAASHVPGNYYQGYIDRLLIYNRPITKNEIKDEIINNKHP